MTSFASVHTIVFGVTVSSSEPFALSNSNFQFDLLSLLIAVGLPIPVATHYNGTLSATYYLLPI